MNFGVPGIGRKVGIGILALAVIIPLALIGAMIVGAVWSTIDPPAATKHADATEVTGYDVIATNKENLDRLVVNKIFIGPVVDRPQDLIVAPGAAFKEINRPGPAESNWLAHGNYPDDCYVSVYHITGEKALLEVSELSDSQRDTIATGEKLVLKMKFACGKG